MSDAGAATPVRAIGIVVIHGVMPHPRYQIQELAAQNLVRELQRDDYWGAARTWVSRVVNLPDATVAKSQVPDPTISRVQVADGNADGMPYFDVIESYWSPLDKGKTTFTSVASWLLQSIFVPLNTTAHYASTLWKTVYDFGLILLGIVAVAGSLAAAFVSATLGFTSLIEIAGSCQGQQCPSTWDVLTSPTKLVSLFPWWTLMVLATGVVGAFLIAQGIKAAAYAWSQKDQLAKHGEQLGQRWGLIAGSFAFGLALLAAAAVIPIDKEGNAGGLVPLWFIASALLFIFGRTIAQSWIVNFFGDVQIYTTRNENSNFYAMREAILSCVTKTIVEATSKYDRVFVLAHSLGSTVAMDALIRFFELTEQEPLLAQQFRRIRAFVTFGTSLEKTKYFFNITNPTPSLALDQWNDALYGALFTPDPHVLQHSNDEAHGIFWLNDWYFLDAVSNRIRSYRSFALPDANLSKAFGALQQAQTAADTRYDEKFLVAPVVALDQLGWKFFVFPEIIPHSEYLVDPWFWASAGSHLGVIDVVASHDPATGDRLDAIPRPAYEKSGTSRFYAVDAKAAARFPDHYKIAPPAPPKSIGTPN